MAYFTFADGMSLYFEEYGQGKPVVFLHGWTSNHEVYQEAAKALADKARLILYDHRGHYMSKEATGKEVTLETLASDLRELIVGLDLDEVTLVGWSMGRPRSYRMSTCPAVTGSPRSCSVT